MDLVKLSGLWKNKDKHGNTFLSGTLNAVSQILVMPNTHKKDGDAKAPDYILYVSPKDNRDGKTETVKRTQEL
jgi:hypothetical protein